MTTISTTSSPFESWLDFRKLRTSSIEYLAKLTGDIWTDYNVHDPGITILEMLCYAVMDLGYRASLPIEQVLAPGAVAGAAGGAGVSAAGGAGTSGSGAAGAGAAGAAGVTGVQADSNFFTPAQILACNPLTILDYRRLLIDIEGVTNAWIEVAKDQHDLCAKEDVAGKQELGAAPRACDTFLNGLYHVYLQVDEDVTTAVQRDAVGASVRKALMAHRNFCEDFADINILCTFEVGVCADIELVVGADIGTVFQQIVARLQDFFSTTPKFYTLQELLAAPKCKAIESVFAGRPYDLTQSHGFVDPDEFENIELRRQIHLSDVYQVILKVDGVKTVRRLALQVCGNKQIAGGDNWVFNVPKNYIPVFNLSCCGWQFSQNNRAVQVDVNSLLAPFNFDFSANAKILYPAGSPYLDLAVKYGSYLPGLGDYYSIQNEFPRVYGIGPGGIPADASPLRKSQALQLKGYLLFFDQMLADYAAQLANIRALFSLQAPAAADQHTYFTSQLATVPGIDDLTRAGATATARAIAVDSKLVKEIRDGKIADGVFEALSRPLAFETVDERNIAVWQFVDDASAGSVITGTFSSGGCFYFYLTGTGSEVALLGRGEYAKVQDALNAAHLLLSSAGQKSNYSLYNLADGLHFSFSVGVDIPAYYNYLQTIVEDQALYQKRRGQFLDHLLARFAEQFVDLAQLSFGFLSGSALDSSIIDAKQQFLTNYVDLSSNRGKGPDYSVNGWYNNNVSGFEKRVEALAGMNTWGLPAGEVALSNRSLCNFVVEQREDRYIIRIVIDGQLLFVADEKLYSREATCLSAMELFRCAADPGNYQVAFDEGVSKFGVKLYYQNKVAWCGPRFDTHGEAMQHSEDVHALFAPTPCEAVVSQYVFRVIITDHSGDEVGLYKEVYRTQEEARGFLDEAEEHAVAAKEWEGWVSEKAGFKDVHVFRDRRPGFINLEGFRFVPDDTIVDKPGKLTYVLIDKAQRFKLLSTLEFDNEEAAREDYYRLIRLMGVSSNLVPVYDERMEGYQIRVGDRLAEGAVSVAVTSVYYPSITSANAMIEGIASYARRHLFFFEIPERPYRWKYAFQFGYGANGRFALRSVKEYVKPELALEASAGVDALLDAGDLKGLEGDKKKETGPLLKLRREVRRLAAVTDPAEFNGFVENETLDKELKYIYRLVDKDHWHGVYLPHDYKNTSAADACRRKKGLFQEQPPYEVIDFCLGGDNIHTRIDPVCGDSYYHFQLKITRCSNPALHGLVLFESVQGYTTAADAQAAFDASYMAILRKGLDASQYGTDKYISTEEVVVNTTGMCVMVRSVVFIPDKTKAEIPWYHIDQLIDRMVALVRLYPIRLITDSRGDREEFKRRFPCFALPPVVDASCSCATAPVVGMYYFYVLSDTAGNEIWQSVLPLTDLQATRTAFEFFLLLLRYPGNYVVERDPCTCEWRILIREVLAESTRRFANRREAWGPQGIEKFICVAQAAGAFHLFHNRKNCCDSFYVACPNPLLLHPCRYDTAERRDKALVELFQAFSDFSKRNLPDLFFPHESNFIYDLHGKAVAIFDQMEVGRDFAVYCCRLLELVDAILTGASFDRTPEGCVIRDNHGKVLAHAVDPEVGLEEWKHRLQEVAWYFPIVREKGEGGKDRFCIEMKLPRFNDPDDDFVGDQGYGCDGWKGNPGAGCWVAWKSNCCYETCQKAFTDYFTVLAVLAERRNYRPVDDCGCGEFRIVLHPSEDIVAFNPQCYVTPDMDCAAAARARALINAEGIHTVEHILLRPRSKEDCRCEAIVAPCPSKTDCHFTWQAPTEDDPCLVNELICFNPGADPYSFIATVAMPAWPQRFRSKENRAYIEFMLAREAPAHVQLRVLWLAPHDLCCFEAHYREWLRWLACKDPCEKGYTPCAFVRFLFRTRFECLGECKECPPCATVQPTPCFTGKGEQLNQIGEYTLLNQIDELYCWAPMDCKKEYQWVDCEVCEECGCDEEQVKGDSEVMVKGDSEVRVKGESEVKVRDRKGKGVEAKEALSVAPPPVKGPPAGPPGGPPGGPVAGPPDGGQPPVEGPPDGGPVDGPPDGGQPPVEGPPGGQPPVEGPPKPPDERERRRFINARLADYKKRLENLGKAAGENDVVEKAKKFLVAKEVTLDRLSKITDKLIEEDTVWKDECAAILCSSFLDMVALRGLQTDGSALRLLFVGLRSVGIDTEAIFQAWSVGLQPFYLTGEELAAFRKIIEGKG
jgi:hypothetical protein